MSIEITDFGDIVIDEDILRDFCDKFISIAESYNVSKEDLVKVMIHIMRRVGYTVPEEFNEEK